ncbi:MAG: type III polyketide synthase [Gemmatimonadales bacterium]|nr:MAG: type III polyketide synthase [Gemmatimonadales bacterium]
MSAWIQRIETSVPPTVYPRERASELMQAHATDRRGVRRIIRSIYRNSGIDKRHSVIDDWGEGTRSTESGLAPLFFRPGDEGDGGEGGEGEGGAGRKGAGASEGDVLLPTPGTGVRNQVYTREARRHFEILARALLDGAPDVEPAQVTHVITISCTGFFAPGPDIHVVQALGLPASTQRYHVGFMGCYAAFQGLRMAESFCRADPDAVVLVLSVELCTLHLQFTEETDDLIAGAVFADGGAGALVRGRRPDGPSLATESFHTALAPEGADDMAWTIGDHGFRMKLSTYVPQIIESKLDTVLSGLLGPDGPHPLDIPWWAIHPGGRQILDRVRDSMGLEPRRMEASRHVLRNYGNMSSATILFVLAELLHGTSTPSRPSPGDQVLALAFGPGLTIESGLFHLED